MNGYNMSVRTTIHIVKNKKESDSGASNAAVGASAGAGAGAGAGAVTYKQPDYTPGKNVLYSAFTVAARPVVPLAHLASPQSARRRKRCWRFRTTLVRSRCCSFCCLGFARLQSRQVSCHS